MKCPKCLLLPTLRYCDAADCSTHNDFSKLLKARASVLPRPRMSGVDWRMPVCMGLSCRMPGRSLSPQRQTHIAAVAGEQQSEMHVPEPWSSARRPLRRVEEALAFRASSGRTG